MLSKLLDFVIGREPVATATGIAAVVTAGLGVGAAFGLDITAEQIAAIGALTAALAGWLGRSAVTPVDTPADREVKRMLKDNARADAAEAELDRGEGGGIILAVLIGVGILVLLIVGFVTCGDALFEDEDEKNDLGLAPALVLNHEDCEWEGDCGGQDYDQNYGSRDDRNRNRNRNRGAFSPGPFDDSPVDAFNGNTVCLPGSTCYTDDRRGDQPPPEGGRA